MYSQELKIIVKAKLAQCRPPIGPAALSEKNSTDISHQSIGVTLEQMRMSIGYPYWQVSLLS